MSDFKTYPQEASEVRQLVDRRRHFLNLIYAMAILAAFQLCTSIGWYAYINEAYYHLIDNTEHFMHMIGLFGQFLAVCLLYIAIYVRRNALMVFLILFYFAAASIKLLQISSFYPDLKLRHKFSPLTRHSEYDSISLIYDSVIFFSSMINTVISMTAVWHFTPLVIVKMDWKNVRKEVTKSIEKSIGNKSARCRVFSSRSDDLMTASESVSKQSYKGTVTRKRSTRAVITDDAKVEVINSKHNLNDGGAYKDGKKTQESLMFKGKYGDK